MITSSGRARTILSVVSTIAGCLAAAFLAMILLLAFTAIISLIVQGCTELFRTRAGKLLCIAVSGLAAIVGGACAIRIVPRLINQLSESTYRFPHITLPRNVFSAMNREVPFAVTTLVSGILACLLIGFAGFNFVSERFWHIPTFITLVMSLCMAAFGFALGAIGWSSIVGDQSTSSPVGAAPGEPHTTVRFRPWRVIGLVAIYYPLCFGPFLQLAARGYFNSADQGLFSSLFRPMTWILESGPPPFRQLLQFYLCFWAPMR
jgi:hypothetical protein